MHRLVSWGNCMRNLSGGGVAVTCGCRGQACVSQIPCLFLWLGVLHPIRRQGTPSDRVSRPVTGAVALAIAISHVIPLRVLQTLNSCRWDCNVFGLSPKVTVGNYVRNVSGAGASTRCPARPRPRPRAPQPGPARCLTGCSPINFACNLEGSGFFGPFVLRGLF